MQLTEEDIFGTWISSKKCSSKQTNTEVQVDSEVTYFKNKSVTGKGYFTIEYDNPEADSNWRTMVVEFEAKYSANWQLDEDTLTEKLIDSKSEVTSLKIDNKYISASQREHRFSEFLESFDVENLLLKEESSEMTILDIANIKMVVSSSLSDSSCSKISEKYKKINRLKLFLSLQFFKAILNYKNNTNALL